MSQFHRNENRMARVLNRIASQWREAYALRDKAGMTDCDMRYCKALHIRGRVLRVMPAPVKGW